MKKNQQQKVLIFDASSLISLTMNGLFDLIRDLKKEFNGKFIITKEVKEELVDNPIKRKKFELEALRLKRLLDEKTIELPSSLDLKDSEIKKETKKILDEVNDIFYTKKGNVKIIHTGEASCLALSLILEKNKIKNILAIDERTTRMLIEKPENLKKLLERKMHINIKTNKKIVKRFKKLKVVRSSELVYAGFKKEIFQIKDPRLLDALLWAVKTKGCAISENEIEEIKKLR